MKKKIQFRISMRLYLVLFVTAEVGLTILVAWGLAELLRHYFQIILIIPDIVLILLFGTVLGGTINILLTHWFFRPIMRLGKAMRQVASGDFSVRLADNHRFTEIKDIYANFNLMVSELEATEILQTDFVSNVSHEFKTPITAIEGYATLLQGREHTVPEEQEQYVEKILFNTKRLSSLVGNILLLSKVDHQSISTKQTTYRLDEQIRQSIVLLEPEWEKKEMEFDVDLERITYTGDEGLLLHVWNNLIGNAIKFNPVGGTIEIRMRQEEGAICFVIEDEGPGISEVEKKHMFDRFYQGDSSHKAEGNGLGLALVKQIVTGCQGSVEAENIAPRGCRFTVLLPNKVQR